MTSYSLHGRYGGKTWKEQHTPSESEALALVAGYAEHWCKLRNSADFFDVIAHKVQDAESTMQL